MLCRVDPPAIINVGGENAKARQTPGFPSCEPVNYFVTPVAWKPVVDLWFQLLGY